MSRLIDADDLELDTEWSDYYDGFMSYSQSQINEAEEVKAIPIERIEQAREEIESNKNTTSLLDCAKFYNKGLDIALAILDKLIKEVEE